jgi:hypothetical protein
MTLAYCNPWILEKLFGVEAPVNVDLKQMFDELLKLPMTSTVNLRG